MNLKHPKSLVNIKKTFVYDHDVVLIKYIRSWPILFVACS